MSKTRQQPRTVQPRMPEIQHVSRKRDKGEESVGVTNMRKADSLFNVVPIVQNRDEVEISKRGEEAGSLTMDESFENICHKEGYRA